MFLISCVSRSDCQRFLALCTLLPWTLEATHMLGEGGGRRGGGGGGRRGLEVVAFLGAPVVQTERKSRPAGLKNPPRMEGQTNRHCVICLPPGV